MTKLKKASERHEVGIHYVSPEAQILYENYQQNGTTPDQCAVDLIAVENKKLIPYNPTLIKLGIIVKPPEGYQMIIIPRSSTFKNHRLMQGNHMGFIDETYIGEKDELRWCACYIPSADERINGITFIQKGTRVAQMYLRKVEHFDLVPYKAEKKSRDGFGSTGV